MLSFSTVVVGPKEERLLYKTYNSVVCISFLGGFWDTMFNRKAFAIIVLCFIVVKYDWLNI